jgi:hypothetical protein
VGSPITPEDAEPPVPTLIFGALAVPDATGDVPNPLEIVGVVGDNSRWVFSRTFPPAVN